MGKTFYDFCVPYSEDEEKLAEILNELCTGEKFKIYINFVIIWQFLCIFQVGYTTVAVSQTFDHTKCSRKTNEIFPAPISLTNLKEKFKQTLTILSRLTILYSHQMITHDINISLNVKKFDLIVGVPTNVQALQHACSSFNGDMIGIVYDDKIKMCLINHRYYQMAARRGIYFEIQYSPVIRNSNHRKDIIVLAQNIVSHKKSNSVVITSGALNVFHVRGPYDVANL